MRSYRNIIYDHAIDQGYISISDKIFMKGMPYNIKKVAGDAEYANRILNEMHTKDSVQYKMMLLYNNKGGNTNGK